jgi:hypothetical protein
LENILEYLVPLVFILAFVLPKFKKKPQRQAEEPAEAKKPQKGLFSRLNKMLEEQYEKNKEAVKKEEDNEEDSQSWWDRSYEEDEKEQEEEQKRVPTTVVVEASDPPSVEKPEPEKKNEPVVEEMIPMPVIKGYKIPQKPATSQYALSKVSKMDLRKAIVWSEILAPPKALRDE